MFKLVRFYILTSILAVVVISTALVLHRQSEIQRLLTLSEAQNIALGHSIANALRHGIVRFLGSAEKLPDAELPSNEQLVPIGRTVAALTSNLPVVKVKIYDRSGRTIYSTNADEIGQLKSDNTGFRSALGQGVPASAFADHGDASTFSRAKFEKDIVETYLPLRMDTGEIAGVFELYSDVTALREEVERENLHLVVAYIGLVTFLYGLMFILAKRADATIRRQHDDINSKNAELREARDNLEQKVQERTRELENEVQERREAEASLRKLSEALEQSPAMTVITDADGLVEYVNPKYTEVSGYLPDMVIGVPVDLGAPEVQEVRRDAPLDVAKSGGSWRGELLNLRKDGSQYWSATTVSSIQNDHGQTQHLLITSEDITGRKRDEEELNRQRAILAHIDRVSLVGEMASSLAHELNQPLTVISGSAQMSLKQIENGSASVGSLGDTVAVAFEQAERASTIIRNMRNFTRSTGQERRTVDINATVREAAELLRADVRDNQVSLELDLGPSLPGVSVDPTQVQQVLINLMLNGIEAMGDLPPEQRVLRIATAPDGMGGVEIAVYNLGEPVPDELKEKIFSPFFTTKAEGLGLGLCISRSLVEAHGGKMRVDAGEAGGSKFWFTLPPSGADDGPLA